MNFVSVTLGYKNLFWIVFFYFTSIASLFLAELHITIAPKKTTYSTWYVTVQI